MVISIEAVYENGVLKPVQPLPLREHDKVQIIIRPPAEVPPPTEATRREYALIPWTGSIEDLDYLIEDAENDPLEGP